LPLPADLLQAGDRPRELRAPVHQVDAGVELVAAGATVDQKIDHRGRLGLRVAGLLGGGRVRGRYLGRPVGRCGVGAAALVGATGAGVGCAIPASASEFRRMNAVRPPATRSRTIATKTIGHGPIGRRGRPGGGGGGAKAGGTTGWVAVGS
jgi:hypothetical protein